MSTTEDFENAPIGATATSPDGRKIYHREKKTLVGADWVRGEGEAKLWADADGLAHFGYKLGPAPSPAPTTTQEALDLAWNLAHEVKEGQTMPSDTQYLLRQGLGYNLRVSLVALSIDGIDAESIRTLDPLPDPEPDWLNAPAVLARGNDWVSCADPQVFVRENKDGTRWVRDTRFYRWDELIDAVPLYPKEGQDA